jgi:hypothetical protein
LLSASPGQPGEAFSVARGFIGATRKLVRLEKLERETIDRLERRFSINEPRNAHNLEGPRSSE